jgi:hypothetical protein
MSRSRRRHRSLALEPLCRFVFRRHSLILPKFYDIYNSITTITKMSNLEHPFAVSPRGGPCRRFVH